MAETPFDKAAPDYDRQWTHSATGRAQRELVNAWLDRHVLKGPARILELNCGTGEDAARLAALGHTVHATDASAAMVGIAASKLARFANGSAQHLPIESIAGLSGRFDLVLSNFGGLNCLDPAAMARLGSALGDKVETGGRVVLVVMPRFCLWETVWNLLHLAPGTAFRRFSRGAVAAKAAPDSTDHLAIWYHAKRSYSDWLGSGFTLRASRPIGFALPPSAMEHVALRLPRLVKFSQAIDHRLPGWPFAAMADHMLLDFERTA